jgi:hypothetical protein
MGRTRGTYPEIERHEIYCANTNMTIVGQCTSERCKGKGDEKLVQMDLSKIKAGLHTSRIHQAFKRHEKRYHSLGSASPVKRGTAKKQLAKAEAEARGLKAKAAAAQAKRLHTETEATNKAITNKYKALQKAVAVLKPHWTTDSMRSDGFFEQLIELLDSTHGKGIPDGAPSRAVDLVESADSDDSHNDSI